MSNGEADGYLLLQSRTRVSEWIARLQRDSSRAYTHTPSHRTLWHSNLLLLLLLLLLRPLVLLLLLSLLLSLLVLLLLLLLPLLLLLRLLLY